MSLKATLDPEAIYAVTKTLRSYPLVPQTVVERDLVATGRLTVLRINRTRDPDLGITYWYCFLTLDGRDEVAWSSRIDGEAWEGDHPVAVVPMDPRTLWQSQLKACGQNEAKALVSILALYRD